MHTVRKAASRLAIQPPLRSLASIALAAELGAMLGCNLTPAGRSTVTAAPSIAATVAPSPATAAPSPAPASPSPSAGRSTRPADGRASARPEAPDNAGPASEVALAEPVGLTFDRAGSLLVGEAAVGRVRAIAPDGAVTTLVDAAKGTIKANFPGLTDLACGADGSLYAVSATSGIHRVRPDGSIAAIPGDAATPGGEPIRPRSIAVGPDGMVYVGEFANDVEGPGPRLLAWKPDGTPRILPTTITLPPGSIVGIAPSADGSMQFAFVDVAENVTLYRRAAKGVTSVIAAYADGQGASDLATSTLGGVYLARPKLGKVMYMYPQGLGSAVVDPETPAASAGFPVPRSVATGPDGTLFMADTATALVYAIRSYRTWEVVGPGAAPFTPLSREENGG